MSNREEVDVAKKEYIGCMGEPLGRLFYALVNEVEWLYIKWKEYIFLYGAEQSYIDLLNKAAPLFFRVVQDLLVESIFLHITRLTDPPKSAGKDNLTIQKIPPLVSDQRLTGIIQSKIGVALQRSVFCRDWRNRHIAHQDLQLVIGEGINPLQPVDQKMVQEALDAIADVLNTVILHYNRSEIGFGVMHINGGGESLLDFINDALRTEEENNGDFL